MKLVIIGYGPGGVAAAFAARAFSKDTEITILTNEALMAHRKPGASLALEFPQSEELFISDWSYQSLSEKQIEVISNVRVEHIDNQTKKLEMVKPNGNSDTLSYDKLIIATGGLPSIPNIPGNSLTGVFTIQDMADASKIGTQLSEMNSIVIIGAGFSGLEIAERLVKMGKDVHMVIRSRIMRQTLEESMSDELLCRLPNNLTVHQGFAPDRIVGTTHVEGVSINKEVIPTDAVLFMTGVKPNLALGENLGLEIGSLGGIKVNERMATSTPDIYAVGDCVEMTDMVSSKPMLIPVASVAARAGRQAGIAAVGSNKIYDEKSLRFQYDNIFGNDIVCVGHSSTTAKNLGIKTRTHMIDDTTEYVKIALVTSDDGVLIGGQVIASRMGARIGYQILERLKSKAVLDERPLLAPRHKQIKDLLQETLGIIQ
ncbi:MAG: NAD(P)/FAD-dependent oxidoreductase [Candidatus Thorarchaeota archaeon]